MVEQGLMPGEPQAPAQDAAVPVQDPWDLPGSGRYRREPAAEGGESPLSRPLRSCSNQQRPRPVIVSHPQARSTASTPQIVPPGRRLCIPLQEQLTNDRQSPAPIPDQTPHQAATPSHRPHQPPATYPSPPQSPHAVPRPRV